MQKFRILETDQFYRVVLGREKKVTGAKEL